MGFNNILIGTDLELLVRRLRMKSYSIWYLWNFWKKLEEGLQRMHFTFKHQYREANRATDFLDWQGESGLTQHYIASDQIPQKLRHHQTGQTRTTLPLQGFLWLYFNVHNYLVFLCFFFAGF